MVVSEQRLNTLVDLAVQSAMNTLRAGLPEFPKDTLESLQEDIEMHLSDTIESYIAGLTEEEYVQAEEPEPF
jgi:hypothetical protein